MLLLKSAFVWAVLFVVHVVFFVTRSNIGDLHSKSEPIEEVPSSSQEPMDILEKEGQLEGLHLQDSSQVVLNKEDSSELKIYDMDYLMGDGAGETKDNFYSLDRDASISIAKKKKKKKPTLAGRKKKNLFKDD